VDGDVEQPPAALQVPLDQRVDREARAERRRAEHHAAAGRPQVADLRRGHRGSMAEPDRRIASAHSGASIRYRRPTRPASQNHISPATPMGATPTDDGTTFRVWAPHAQAVYVVQGGSAAYAPADADLLVEGSVYPGHWTGFFEGVGDGSLYRFWIVGAD